MGNTTHEIECVLEKSISSVKEMRQSDHLSTLPLLHFLCRSTPMEWPEACEGPMERNIFLFPQKLSLTPEPACRVPDHNVLFLNGSQSKIKL